MRIGFDAKRAFLNRSGLGNYSRDIIRSLHQAFPDNEYILYTPRIGTLSFPDDKSFTVTGPPESFDRLRQAYWRSVLLTDRIRQDNVDIYHGLSNELPRGIDKTGTKSVVTIHDLIFMRHPQWYRPIDRFIYRQKFSYSSRVADRVIAVSQQTKNDLVEYFGISDKKISVIYQGCNKAFYHKLNEQQKSETREKWNLPGEYLLYVGTVEERKNLLTLVKAIHQYRIMMPLVVVGRHRAYMKQVGKYIESEQIKNILFLEEVAVEDMPGIYQMAKIFIYPSVFEGFGIPILEAILSGVPVITSKGGCFSEVGGESSVYIDPSDPGELGAELLRLLDNSALRDQMTAAGLKHSGRFSNERIAEEIFGLYKGLLND
jgi:glycosyltransferase involved in cell wall biosynthesis